MLNKQQLLSSLEIPYLKTIGLAAFALATWWLAFSQEPIVIVDEGAQVHKIDYFLKSFNALTMTEEGLPKERVEATFMEHFSDNDTTELTAPRVTMYSSDKPNLYIKSETGYVSSDGELVLLNGAVTIRREAKGELEPLIVDTQNLRVQLSNDYAETDEHVKIVSKGSSIEGTGLSAHFREPVYVKIQSSVRGKHAIK
jgi:lipopolysaccharide export system protein LptC